LVFWGQMKEAAPGDNSAECATQVQRPHVGNVPLMVGKPLDTHFDHRARRIHAAQLALVFDEVFGDRSSGPTTDVENRAVLVVKQCQKPVAPSPFQESAGAITRPRQGMALIDLNDSRGTRFHSTESTETCREERLVGAGRVARPQARPVNIGSRAARCGPRRRPRACRAPTPIQPHRADYSGVKYTDLH